MMGISHFSGLKEVLFYHVREGPLMPKKKAVKSVPTFRQCANCKSRKHPDVQCPCPAVQGDFCARHGKNPVRFQKAFVQSDSQTNLSTLVPTESATRIQRWWNLHIGIRNFVCQGPAHTESSLAENDTELFSFESPSTIPKLYRWSYADAHKHIWLFDIRSLYMSHAEHQSDAITNPYTRDVFPKQAELSFHSRCQWLRDRKYCLRHMSNETLTPEQIWHQTILDVILKYDVLGYHICVSWIEELHLFQLQNMYVELWELWFTRLSQQPSIKELVVPGWRSIERPLFKVPLTHIQVHFEKKWWQRILVELLERFVSSAHTKEHKIIGALYGMTALAIVSPRVRVHYPWLVGE